MTEPLSPDRFRHYAEAYGAAVARWPEAVRAAGTIAARQPWAHAILVEAERLDTVLDGWTVAPPSPALAAAVLPRPSLGRRARLWLSGLGIAAALGGAAAGSVAAAAIAPIPSATAADTAFGDLGPQEG